MCVSLPSLRCDPACAAVFGLKVSVVADKQPALQTLDHHETRTHAAIINNLTTSLRDCNEYHNIITPTQGRWGLNCVWLDINYGQLTV